MQEKTAAILFVAPAELQDEITPAGPALRPGLIDAASAKLLGVTPPTAPASASHCWPEVQVQPSPSSMSKQEVAKEVVNRIVAEAENADDVAALLALLAKKLAAHYPQCGEQVGSCKQCQRVAPALSAFRSGLSGAELLRLDGAVSTRIGSSFRKVRPWGLPISREKWQQAQAKEAGAVVKPKRGRPSKLNDPAIVQKVVDCIMANRQENNICVKPENCLARTLTSSLLRALGQCLGHVCSMSTVSSDCANEM